MARGFADDPYKKSILFLGLSMAALLFTVRGLEKINRCEVLDDISGAMGLFCVQIQVISLHHKMCSRSLSLNRLSTRGTLATR